MEIRSVSAICTSAGRQGTDWPCTISRQASKLLRGPMRAPPASTVTGLVGSPPQVTVWITSRRKNSRYSRGVRENGIDRTPLASAT